MFCGWSSRFHLCECRFRRSVIFCYFHDLGSGNLSRQVKLITHLASPILYSCHTLMPSIVAVWNVVNEAKTIAFKRLWLWHCRRIIKNCPHIRDTHKELPSHPSHPGYHCLIPWFSSFGWQFQRHSQSSGMLWHGSWLWLLFSQMTLFHLGGLKNPF